MPERGRAGEGDARWGRLPRWLRSRSRGGVRGKAPRPLYVATEGLVGPLRGEQAGDACVCERSGARPWQRAARGQGPGVGGAAQRPPLSALVLSPSRTTLCRRSQHDRHRGQAAARRRDRSAAPSGRTTPARGCSPSPASKASSASRFAGRSSTSRMSIFSFFPADSIGSRAGFMLFLTIPR